MISPLSVLRQDEGVTASALLSTAGVLDSQRGEQGGRRSGKQRLSCDPAEDTGQRFCGNHGFDPQTAEEGNQSPCDYEFQAGTSGYYHKGVVSLSAGAQGVVPVIE